jgi:hypothetical protein
MMNAVVSLDWGVNVCHSFFMAIKWNKSNDAAPEFPDECADCGSWMNSKVIGSDGVARCVACSSATHN